MNPSFEAFVDPPDGFHEKPGTRSNREGQFSPPEARVVVEPRMHVFFPELLQTAKDILHSPRPRIAG